MQILCEVKYSGQVSGCSSYLFCHVPLSFTIDVTLCTLVVVMCIGVV